MVSLATLTSTSTMMSLNSFEDPIRFNQVDFLTWMRENESGMREERERKEIEMCSIKENEREKERKEPNNKE